MVERPYLRPYFYDNQAWAPGDRAARDEVLAMAELILNNFASALMHSAAFPQYPVGSVDQTIKFHLRQSPALRDYLFDGFERFPISGLTLLCLKNPTAGEVEDDLRGLIERAAGDAPERQRREHLLALFRRAGHSEALAFTRYNLDKARGQAPKSALLG
jgi:hypothetical protein